MAKVFPPLGDKLAESAVLHLVLLTGACLECRGEGGRQAHNLGRAAGVWATCRPYLLPP